MKKIIKKHTFGENIKKWSNYTQHIFEDIVMYQSLYNYII